MNQSLKDCKTNKEVENNGEPVIQGMPIRSGKEQNHRMIWESIPSTVIPHLISSIGSWKL